ncbi:MAG: DUF4199 domain-containing protein [Bacteroidota bacterium]
MIQIVFVFGLIAGLICAAVFLLFFPREFSEMNMENQELIGYTSMIIALSTIFFAVKQYRDKHLGGTIKFGKAFLIGLYITMIAGTIYAVSWEIYYRNYGQEFADSYVTQLRAGMAEDGMTEQEIDEQLASQEAMMEAYKENVAVRLGVTFMELFPVGLLVSLICALIFGVLLKPNESSLA